MTWEDYYNRFYDWAESTQVRYLSTLSTLGPADEVAEIIIALQMNESASNRLLRRAVESKLAFSGTDLEEFVYNNDNELATAAIRNSTERLTAEDMKNLYCVVDDDAIIIEICKQCNLPLPEPLCEEEYKEEEPSYSPSSKQPGFFAKLFSIFAYDDANGSYRHRNNGHCNGDCAHCPPHYGYRYGRWYYGHGHIYGCEFGGNKGGGNID